MGFRLNVKIKDNVKWFGDDHKLYGYVPYKNVRNSFDMLVPYIKEQWKGLYEDADNDHIYDLMCCVPATNELVLDNYMFTKWALAYIEDLEANKRDEEVIQRVSEYLLMLSGYCKNDKVLEWS